jgi:hypothetical protein
LHFGTAHIDYHVDGVFHSNVDDGSLFLR